MKAIFLAVMLFLAAHSQILEFNEKAVEKIFQQKSTALFLFIQDLEKENNVNAHQAFQNYDQTNPEIVLSVSRNNDGHGLFERLAEYLGVDVSSTPAILLMNQKTEKFKFDGDTITAETLADFVKRVSGGAVLPFLKSAPIPEPNDDPVQVVVGKNFNDVVLKSEKEVLVKFYAPWCGHCKTLAPHFEQAARKLSGNPNVLFVMVDSTENEVSGVDIQGFPTVKFWKRDKSAEPLDYNGERTADGIVRWIKEHTDYEWIPTGDEVATEAAAEQEL